MTTMRAAVAQRPGPPEVLEVKDVPRPEPRPGWSLIQVKAFGLNRSELMTRQGHSPGVLFPRILGIECVGVVAESSGTGPTVGATVAAVMGEMGRAFDGGYAEYALLPDDLLIPINTELEWPTFGALPETYLTAHGGLDTLDLAHGDTVLIRGGTSSVGMAALSLAKGRGLTTVATTRSAKKAALLRERGADHVLIDDGEIEKPMRAILSDGPHGIFDMVGSPASIKESLQLVMPRRTVCVVGMLTGVWVIDDFEAVAMIPSGTKLTAYHSDDAQGRAGQAALQEIADGVATGRYHANVDRVFGLGEIADAHRFMEANQAVGKIVVALD